MKIDPPPSCTTTSDPSVQSAQTIVRTHTVDNIAVWYIHVSKAVWNIHLGRAVWNIHVSVAVLNIHVSVAVWNRHVIRAV